MKTLKRYIPTLVKEKLNNVDFKDKEKLFVICDMIFRSSIFKKCDKTYNNDYVDIPSYYFRDIITEYKKPVDFLIENKIIECDGFYSKEAGKSLGYRFNEKYISLLTEVLISKITIKKKIINNKNKRNNLVKKSLSTYKDFYLKKFDIDYNKALSYLNNWYEESMFILNDNNDNNKYKKTEFIKECTKVINKYNSIFISISAIKDGDLFFKKNKTNGRIDTNLTSLKSEYKQFIKSDDELYSIDIINSQPFILSLLLDKVKNKEEVQKYKDWTSNGNFYENFGKSVYTRTGKEITRKEIKKLMFCIFYSKNASYCKQKEIFKSIFPSIYDFIKDKKKKQHNRFAIELQKAESEICIDIICKELDDKNISYYTIHDSFIVKKSDIYETKKTIFDNFKLKYNNIPSLSTEKVNI